MNGYYFFWAFDNCRKIEAGEGIHAGWKLPEVNQLRMITKQSEVSRSVGAR